jgi:RHS repeat-associated protein
MRRDPQRQKVLLVDSKGNQTVIEHNKNGHTLSARDAAGLVSENAYDPNGQLIYSSVTPGSPPESQIFDAGNRKLISIVGAEQTEVQYDEAGFPTKQIDPAGRVSEYVYEKGLLRRFESPSGALWKFDYDERGELRAFSMPNGRVIQRTVSNDWRTETLADNYGVMEIVTYDDLGRMILFEDSGGFKTRIWYGKRDELTIATLPDGGVVRYEYDAEGNLIRDTNELGQITEYTFTPFGHLASTVRSGVWRLGREYDTEDNMVAVTTPAGAVARMEYNSRSLMTALRSFDGRETSFRYDNRNQLASCTELPSGNKIEYSYGGQSEVLRAVYSDGGFIDTQYAANGNIIGLANESCQLKFEWDPDGNLIRESRGNDWVEYEYDSLGNVSSVSSSWGIYLNYGWDLRGRLIAASLGSAQTYQFGYDGRDLVTSCLWPNGFDERMVYDSTARLIGSRLYDRSGSEIHRVDYTYDAADRLVRVSRHDGVIVEYFYDPLDRVTHVHRNGALAESYDYDLDGNLLRLRDGTPLEAQRGGRIRFAGSNREVEYNDSGGLARQTVDGKTFAYGYNAMGQLTTVTDHLGNRTEFAYDALGRRLRKISRGGSTDYLWTSLAPLAERSSTGPVNFLFLPGSFFLKAADNGAPFSFVLDHLGSPICAFSGLEEPPIETERSLWSELMPASQPASLPRMGRLGQYWDDEIGLYYNWHRYYDPALARYLQPDPLDLSGGLNLYAYPEQPLAWVDPFGLYTCRIKMNECWNEAQEADAAKKLDSLNEKKKENKNRRKPGRNCYQTAAERWKYCKGKGRLTKDQLKDKRQFRLPCKVQHIDHILEKQLKGGDDCDNLQALNAKVNMSFGAQILRCRRAAGWRTPSSFQFYKTKTIPCKPGEEC